MVADDHQPGHADHASRVERSASGDDGHHRQIGGKRGQGSLRAAREPGGGRIGDDR